MYTNAVSCGVDVEGMNVPPRPARRGARPSLFLPQDVTPSSIRKTDIDVIGMYSPNTLSQVVHLVNPIASMKVNNPLHVSLVCKAGIVYALRATSKANSRNFFPDLHSNAILAKAQLR